MAVTSEVTSVDSSVCTFGILVEVMAIRCWIRLTSPPTMRPSEARLLFDAVAGNLRRKVQPTGEVAGAGGEDLCFLHILDARDLLERSLNRCLEGGKRNHTPVSRARLRMVGAPFPSRLVCMGWPFPQLGIGLSRKSRPTASTFIR